MKVTIEYDGPDARQEAQSALQVGEMEYGIHEMSQLLRQITKYDAHMQNMTDAQKEGAHMIADLIRSEFFDNLGGYIRG